jgi:hypothetical protein
MEATNILKLALWKIKMNEMKNLDMSTQCQKKMNTVESSTRQQCRVTCGAYVVIGRVLPYIISV